MTKYLQKRWLMVLPAMLAAFALVGVACGGDSEGSDEDWVKAVCSGFQNFDENIAEAQEKAQDLDPDGDAEREAAKLMAEPVSELAKDIDKGNPPADLKDAHNALVSALKTAADALEDGDLSILTELGDSMDSFDPSQEVQDRISAVAENTAECDEVGLFTE